jgi:hypothetical protein
MLKKPVAAHAMWLGSRQINNRKKGAQMQLGINPLRNLASVLGACLLCFGATKPAFAGYPCITNVVVKNTGPRHSVVCNPCNPNTCATPGQSFAQGLQLGSTCFEYGPLCPYLTVDLSACDTITLCEWTGEVAKVTLYCFDGTNAATYDIHVIMPPNTCWAQFYFIGRCVDGPTGHCFGDYCVYLSDCVCNE